MSKTDNTMALSLAAQKLGLAYGRARDLLLVGTLRGWKIGGHWFVTRESVERHLSHRKLSDAEWRPAPAEAAATSRRS